MTVYHVMPPSVEVVYLISHILILSRKPTGTAMESSCFKSEQVNQALF